MAWAQAAPIFRRRRSVGEALRATSGASVGTKKESTTHIISQMNEMKITNSVMGITSKQPFGSAFLMASNRNMGPANTKKLSRLIVKIMKRKDKRALRQWNL